ncbi:MAG: c-type cytochrome [Acidobacteria bacterium]|nr:c-type cytochrome [Acidobacteriota bacterium]
MPSTKWVVVCLLLAWLIKTAVAQEKAPEKKIVNPLGKDKTAIEAGRTQFNSGCAVCHGPTGQGGRGSRLAEVDRVQKMPDAKMFEIIKEGVSGTQMPPSALPDEKIWQLVSFIRSLNASAIDQDVTGDGAAGESLFFSSGRCSACHMIRGQGGLIGPDLSNAGARRSLSKLRQAIQDPDALIEPGYSKVTAVTRDGRRISGVAKNNSNYSILIQDAQGRFYSLLKKDLKTLTHHKGSLMPKPSLSETEQQNLLAFLSRQSLETPAERTRRIEHGKEIKP